MPLFTPCCSMNVSDIGSLAQFREETADSAIWTDNEPNTSLDWTDRGPEQSSDRVRSNGRGRPCFFLLISCEAIVVEEMGTGVEGTETGTMGTR